MYMYLISGKSTLRNKITPESPWTPFLISYLCFSPLNRVLAFPLFSLKMYCMCILFRFDTNGIILYAEIGFFSSVSITFGELLPAAVWHFIA